MTALARLGIILGGLFAACATAAATTMFGTPDLACSKIDFLCGVIFIVFSLNALAIAALPALILILYTEARSVRSISIYLGFGIVVSLLPLLRAPLVETIGSVIAWQNLPVMIAGLIGGLTYWIIAGRRAGDWPDPAASSN
jgi:hypothetical protein